MIRTGSAAIVLAIGLILSGSARAADLQVGQAAPGFTLPDQDGKMHSLKDYAGKWVILAFYPKDFTGG